MQDQDIEQWHPIPGHAGYEASTHGRIRSTDRVVTTRQGVARNYRGKVLSPVPVGIGHLRVQLGYQNFHLVHRLVALTFHGPCPPGLEVRHWPDTDPTNNRPENLAYGTRAQNMQDRIVSGNNPQLNRTHCPHGHEYAPWNLMPSQLPKRACLACSRGRSNKRHADRAARIAASHVAYAALRAANT